MGADQLAVSVPHFSARKKNWSMHRDRDQQYSESQSSRRIMSMPATRPAAAPAVEAVIKQVIDEKFGGPAALLQLLSNNRSTRRSIAGCSPVSIMGSHPTSGS
jgi:hypothetical protein